MIRCPSLESIFVVGDDACLLAEISSFFRRERHYLPISDGPRMARPDWTNEAIRRRNSIARVNPTKILFAGLAADAAAAQSTGLPQQRISTVATRAEAAASLRGTVKPRDREMRWPASNLGVGLLLARHTNCSLVVDQEEPEREQNFVADGNHALVVCETSENLSHVIAANLAFSIRASFLAMPEILEARRRILLEDLYLVGGREQRKTLREVLTEMREILPAEVVSQKYSEIIFVTSELPWGLAVPECPTSHLYAYPDLGRLMADGVWAANNPSTSSRTALLVDPGEVRADDINVIEKALKSNGTLVRAMRGRGANVHAVEITTQTVPFDIIAIATHAGDWHGDRVTYQYPDFDGRMRTLVVDEAVGIGYDPAQDLYPVQVFYAFRSLDGVPWEDDEAKQRLPVGSAMLAWTETLEKERREYIVASEPLQRVRGAMALKMSDHVWLLGGHDLASPSQPIVLNNACSSFHELAGYFSFGGAQVYIGTAVPISDAEALDITKKLFGEFLGDQLATSLWKAQKSVYGDQDRQPYLLVGLPFAKISRNTSDSLGYLRRELRRNRDIYALKAETHADASVRRNSTAARNHLNRELEILDRRFLGART